MIPHHHQLEPLSFKSVGRSHLRRDSILSRIPVSDQIKSYLVQLSLPMQKIIEISVFPIIIYHSTQLIQHRERIRKSKAGEADRIRSEERRVGKESSARQ